MVTDLMSSSVGVPVLYGATQVVSCQTSAGSLHTVPRCGRTADRDLTVEQPRIVDRDDEEHHQNRCADRELEARGGRSTTWRRRWTRAAWRPPVDPRHACRAGGAPSMEEKRRSRSRSTRTPGTVRISILRMSPRRAANRFGCRGVGGIRLQAVRRFSNDVERDGEPART